MYNFFTPGWILFFSLIVVSALFAFKSRNKLKMSSSLLEGSIPKGIFSYTIPLLIGALFQQFYNLVDSIVVGQIIGINALAAVNLAGTLMWFITSFFGGLAMGIGVLIAQFFGANQQENLTKAINTAYIIFTAMGVLLAITGIIFSRPILELLNTPPEVIEDALTYIRIIFVGFVGMALYYVAATVMQSTGDSTTPFLFLALSTILNIVLDILFVAVWGFGVAGAAYATVISYFASAIGCFVTLAYHKDEHLRFSIKNLKYNHSMAMRALKLGLPTAIQQTTQSLGFLLQARMINDFGASALAAYGAVSRIDGLLLLPAYNFSGAMATYMGQNLGAGQMARARKGVWITMAMSVGSTILFCIPAYFFRENLITIFIPSNELQTIHYGAEYFRIALWGYPFTALAFLLMGSIRGAGKATSSLVISLTSLWLVRLPSAYLMVTILGLGLNGIWLSSPLHWASAALMAIIYFIFGKWQTSKVVD